MNGIGADSKDGSGQSTSCYNRAELMDGSDGGERFKSMVHVQLINNAGSRRVALDSSSVHRKVDTQVLVISDVERLEVVSIDDRKLCDSYKARLVTAENVGEDYILLVYATDKERLDGFTF